MNACQPPLPFHCSTCMANIGLGVPWCRLKPHPYHSLSHVLERTLSSSSLIHVPYSLKQERIRTRAVRVFLCALVSSKRPWALAIDRPKTGVGAYTDKSVCTCIYGICVNHGIIKKGGWALT